ncbi:hypothetical protein QBC32DRAFT_222434, partial [Pseudoneurospora amorphoporcata]
YKPKSSLLNINKFIRVNYSFETWLPNLRAKLYIDSNAISNNKAQFFYIYNKLDNKIQVLVMPQLQQTSDSNSFNSKELIDQLNRIFDDPYKVQQAQNTLFTLK